MTEATITVEDVQSPSPDKIIKIVHIVGQLDESNVDEKIQEIYKLVEANPKGLNLIFDLEKLEYMNSKSIGYLTDLYGKITESGGQVAIAGAQANIVDILQVVGLTQLIKTFGTIDEAKNYMTTSSAATALAQGTEAAPAQPPAAPPAPPAPAQPAPAPVQPETPPVQPQAPVEPPAPPETPPQQPPAA